MRKLLLIILVVNSIFCFAQIGRSGKFKLNASYEYRVVPFFYKGMESYYWTTNQYRYNISRHLDGSSLNLDIEYFFLKNTSFVLTQSVRYDELYADSLLDGSTNNYDDVKKSRLIGDTHLQIKHYFELKNENHSLIGQVGYSFMNFNTSFYVNEIVGVDENENNIYTRTSHIDWKFNALKIGVGYRYKRFETLLGSYFVSKHNFEGRTYTGFGMPFIKINYNFLNF